MSQHFILLQSFVQLGFIFSLSINTVILTLTFGFRDKKIYILVI